MPNTAQYESTRTATRRGMRGLQHQRLGAREQIQILLFCEDFWKQYLQAPGPKRTSAASWTWTCRLLVLLQIVRHPRGCGGVGSCATNQRRSGRRSLRVWASLRTSRSVSAHIDMEVVIQPTQSFSVHCIMSCGHSPSLAMLEGVSLSVGALGMVVHASQQYSKRCCVVVCSFSWHCAAKLL